MPPHIRYVYLVLLLLNNASAVFCTYLDMYPIEAAGMEVLDWVRTRGPRENPARSAFGVISYPSLSRDRRD